jgi:hypothetical protein
MVGKRYYAESFYPHFVSDKEPEFIVEKSPDLPKGSAYTVDITVRYLRDELYMISWQEKSGDTVVHPEDSRDIVSTHF